MAEEFVAQLEAEMGETYESAIGTEAGKYYDKLKKKLSEM